MFAKLHFGCVLCFLRAQDGFAGVMRLVWADSQGVFYRPLIDL
ncbi:hypothetical protein [Streptomyces showdoensis]|nr:hypothetical protein [Streptomyces showdoensis]